MPAEKNQRGISLIETILAIAVLSLLLGGISGVFLYGQESTQYSGQLARASFLADEGLEALRSIRNNNFSSLSAGTYGLDSSGGQWSLSGSSDITGIFTREIIISSVDADRFDVTSRITWQRLTRSGEVSGVTRFTNWAETTGAGAGASSIFIDTSAAALVSGDNTRIGGITIENTGGSDQTITEMIVSWTGGANGNDLREVVIDGGSVWSGNVSSGTTIDITDTLIASGAGAYDIDYIDFKKSISGGTVTLTFTLDDASSTTTPQFSI